jgi:four helix bundle protein
MKPLFDHDRLSAYNLAREALREMETLFRQAPRGCGELLDQLRRASLSVLLNLAEGSGEFSRGEKIRFYRMARRSACECAAGLDYLVDRGIFTAEIVEPTRILYARAVGATINLIASVERRPDKNP